MIEVKNFRKAYGNHVILDIPCLSLPKGLVWLKGINGSGKSTFLKSLSGIIPFEGDLRLQLDSGYVNYRGNENLFRSEISYSFAEPNFPGYVSAKEILDFYRKAKGGQKMDELIDAFKVATYYKDRIDSYSSGMLKKISLIAALAGEATILALDEPYTTIDVEAQAILTDILLQRIKNEQTVLLASHHEVEQLNPHLAASFLVAQGTITAE